MEYSAVLLLIRRLEKEKETKKDLEDVITKLDKLIIIKNDGYNF